MSVTLARLRTNELIEPLGIDDPRPSFSWTLTGGREGAGQASYRVVVSSHRTGETVWDSGWIASTAQAGIRYAGTELASSERYTWTVEVLDDSGERAVCSSWFELGKRDAAELTATWIGQAAPVDDRTAVYFRRVLTLPSDVVRARAIVSALGWYRFFVNGVDVSGTSLVPRWTPLDDIVEYQVYDVTDILESGVNSLAAAVGDGKYRGFLGAADTRATYGDRLGLFVQFEYETADGLVHRIHTDEDWQAGPGRILSSDPKHGERRDQRIPDADWLSAQPTVDRLRPAVALPPHRRRLVATEVQPVRSIAEVPALAITRAPSGRWIVDFGQNFAGTSRARLSGAAGTTVTLTYSERLTDAGELDTEYIQFSKKRKFYQRDVIVLDGTDSEVETWFTIHGFRYVEIQGLAAEPSVDDFTGIVLSTDAPTVGSFECSDPRLERLHANVLWSLRSNFTDTATDCPTRERDGWTGDIQVFTPTATTLVDVQPFLRRYLRNLAIEQHDDGEVPAFIPSDSSEFSGGPDPQMRKAAEAAGWGDAAVMVPWALYEAYGDTRVLEAQYASMTRWVDSRRRRAARRKGSVRWFRKGVGDLERYVIDTGFAWGEWLRPGESKLQIIRDLLIPRTVVATAYFAHSARLLGQIAGVLGRSDDSADYLLLADRARAAFRAAFVRPDGTIGEDKQDDYVRALAFDLLLPSQRGAAFDRLVALIERAGIHLGTGFLSTPMLLDVLADGGRLDLAYQLLLQTSSPSWLYQVERGATTVWETWEGVESRSMSTVSLNHYAFGAVAHWLVTAVAGLAPAEPGYRRIRVAPRPGGGLTRAGTTLETPFGRASSRWSIESGMLVLDIEIPSGTTAEVHTPDRLVELESGTHRLEWAHADRATARV